MVVIKQDSEADQIGMRVVGVKTALPPTNTRSMEALGVKREVARKKETIELITVTKGDGTKMTSAK